MNSTEPVYSLYRLHILYIDFTGYSIVEDGRATHDESAAPPQRLPPGRSMTADQSTKKQPPLFLFPFFFASSLLLSCQITTADWVESETELSVVCLSCSLQAMTLV